jgi:hypothetical protein
MHNAVTSGFALGLVSKIRVSRVFFSGPYQSVLYTHAYAGCARSNAAAELRLRGVGELRRLGEVVLRVRA